MGMHLKSCEVALGEVLTCNRCHSDSTVWRDSVQAAQEAVQQVADSSKETVSTGRVHATLSLPLKICDRTQGIRLEVCRSHLDGGGKYLLTASIANALKRETCQDLHTHKSKRVATRSADSSP